MTPPYKIEPDASGTAFAVTLHPGTPKAQTFRVIGDGANAIRFAEDRLLGMPAPAATTARKRVKMHPANRGRLRAILAPAARRPVARQAPDPMSATLAAIAAAGRAAGRSEADIAVEQRKVLQAAIDQVRTAISDAQDSENIARVFRGESRQPTLRDQDRAIQKAFNCVPPPERHAENKMTLARGQHRK